jgi:adenosylcobinamide-GDP ribazoletransferase
MGLRLATAFLTRVPATRARDEPTDLARAVPWFPVVGAVVGLTVAGIYAGASTVLPTLVAAAIAVGAGVALTGALHEDGLADLADALGGRTPDEARRIMKDPAHGTYGIIALLLSLLLRIGALSALGGWAAVAALPAAHALGRSASTLLLLAPPAAGAGLGATFAGSTRPRQVAVAIIVGATIAAIGLRGWALPALVVAGIGTALAAGIAQRKLGGVTGDVMGAAEQVGETLVLLLAVAAIW